MPQACNTLPFGNRCFEGGGEGAGTVDPGQHREAHAEKIDTVEQVLLETWRRHAPGPATAIGRLQAFERLDEAGGVNTSSRQAVAPTEKPSSSVYSP